MTETHTPLPWRVRALENFGWNIVHYLDGDKFNLKRIAKVSTEEDATRIVQAVNSHHDLIEALRGLLDEIRKSARADTILDSAAAGKAFAAIAEVEGRRG